MSTRTSSLKDEKEAFVTGHNGTTVLEILLVCSSAPIGIFLFHEIRNLFQWFGVFSSSSSSLSPSSKSSKLSTSSSPLPNKELPTSLLIFIESMTVLFPMALCQTELLYPYGITVLYWELSLALILHFCRRYRYEFRHHYRYSTNANANDNTNVSASISNCASLLGCVSNGSADSNNSSVSNSNSNNNSNNNSNKKGNKNGNPNPKLTTSTSPLTLPSPLSSPSSRLGAGGGKATQYQHQYPFLTFYRSTVSYLTFVAILAVDFTIFPRSFAKTEVYGYGLMDLGAASFCVLGGLVSWFARQKTKINMNINSTTTSTVHTKRYFSKNTHNNNNRNHHLNHQRMKKVLRNTVPLLIMGFIRLITTKGLDYQEHVSEYGVHWNFFFTLALVNILTTAIRSYLNYSSFWGGVGTGVGIGVYPILPWMGLLVVYQLLLSVGEVQEYIVDAPRKCMISTSTSTSTSILDASWWNIFYICDFFAANREGLLGSIGYTVLFLASEDIGKYCLWSIPSTTTTTNTTATTTTTKGSNGSSSSNSSNNKNTNPSLVQGRRLLFTTIVFWYLHWISSSSSMFGFGIPASRRSTNGTFILWTLAHNMAILLLIWLAFHYGAAGGPMVTENNNNNNINNNGNNNDKSTFTVQRGGSAGTNGSGGTGDCDHDMNTNMNLNMNIVAMNPPIFAAVNRHGLLVFILANLMTGIVNLSINTLEASRGVAIVVIFLYLCGIGAVALIIDKLLSDRAMRLKTK